MKRTFLIICCLASGWLPVVRATGVTFSGTPSTRTVVDADGITTVTSGLVWVGTFGNESFTFNPALSIAANVAAMTTAGAWEQFGLDTVTNLANAGSSSTISISGSGKVGGAVTDNNFGPTKADFFNNKPLYLWMFNAATPAAATEMGIFHATSATQPWTFPTNNGGVGDATTYTTLNSAAPTIAAIGGAGSTDSTRLVLAAAVPEPSVLALTGLAGLGMLALRRRREHA